MTTPICHFAVFAHEFRAGDNVHDLLGIHNRVSLLGKEGQTRGLSRFAKTLYVSIIADEGKHVLVCTHEVSQFSVDFEFEILPEHGNTFLAEIEADFPLYFDSEPTLNEYQLFLDNEPLGVAYLIAHLF